MDKEIKQLHKIIAGFAILLAVVLGGLPRLEKCAFAAPSTNFQSASHQTLADDYLRAGKPDEAIMEYEMAVVDNPFSTAVYFNMAIAYYEVRNIEGAVSALEKLIALAPEDVEAHYNLACLKLYLHDEVGAKRHLETAHKLSKENTNFYPLIIRGLQFIEELSRTNTNEQDIVFFLLHYGLAPVTLTS